MSSGQLTIQGVLLPPPGLPHVPCFNLAKPMSHPVQGFSSLRGLRRQCAGVGLGLSRACGGSVCSGDGETPCPCKKGCSFPLGRQMFLQLCAHALVSQAKPWVQQQRPLPPLVSADSGENGGGSAAWGELEEGWAAVQTVILTTSSGTSWVSCLKPKPWDCGVLEAHPDNARVELASVEAALRRRRYQWHTLSRVRGALGAL